MNLMIFSDKEKNKFRIGGEGEDFYMTSDMSISSNLINVSEEEVTNISQSFGAQIEYYDYRKDVKTTKETYMKHFENYNSDESYILPCSTFSSREQANQCIVELLKRG